MSMPYNNNNKRNNINSELLPKNTQLTHCFKQSNAPPKFHFEPYRSNEIRVWTAVGCVDGMDFKLVKTQQREID